MLITIWLALVGKVQYNKTSTFVISNILVWPSGVAIVLSSYWPYLYPLDFKFNGNYLVTYGCQPNYAFHLANNGKDCLIDKKGKVSLLVFYLLLFMIMIASHVTFFLIFSKLYNLWKELQEISHSETSAGYFVAAKNSEATFKRSIKFSITCLIYVIVWLPLFIQQFLSIFYGPFSNSEGFIFTLTTYFLTIGPVIPLMNVMLYGPFSQVFRKEMIRIFKVTPRRTTVFARRCQDTLLSLTHSNRYGSQTVRYNTLSSTDYNSESD